MADMIFPYFGDFHRLIRSIMRFSERLCLTELVKFFTMLGRILNVGSPCRADKQDSPPANQPGSAQCFIFWFLRNGAQKEKNNAPDIQRRQAKFDVPADNGCGRYTSYFVICSFSILQALRGI